MSADIPEGRHAPGTPDHFRAAVEATLERSKVPGCTIAAVGASGARWSDAFGYADLQSRRRAETDTLYHLFSGTKLFTAVAVLQLEERGLLGLDDPIAHYVPRAKEAPGVTLLHLLSHRSGLGDTLRGFLSVRFPPETLPTTAEALEAYRIAPAGPPGRRVQYRNVNYALLGEVVSRVSGVEYRSYLSQQVLDPLGMDVGFRADEDARPRTATGYIGRWDPMRLALRVTFPDLGTRLYGERVNGLVALNGYDLATSAIGGLVGPMPEFARFLGWQLGGPGGILKAESVRRMQTLVAEGKPGIESRVGMGLGWKIGRVEGRTFLNHEGGGAGFTSELRLYPDQGLGIALAMNTMRMPRTMRTAHRLCEAVFAARADLLPGSESAVPT